MTKVLVVVPVGILALIAATAIYISANSVPASGVLPCELPQAVHDLHLQPCS